jgi:hypothetical protein
MKFVWEQSVYQRLMPVQPSVTVGLTRAIARRMIASHMAWIGLENVRRRSECVIFVEKMLKNSIIIA